MDVRLPNGLVVHNVPEGTTKAQLVDKLVSNHVITPDQGNSFLGQQAGGGAPQIHFPPGTTEAEKQAVLAQANGSAPSMGEQLLHAGAQIGKGALDSVTEAVGGVPDLIAAGLRGIGATELAPTDPHFYTQALKSGEQRLGAYLQSKLTGSEKPSAAPPTTLDKELYGLGHGAADAASVFVPARLVSNVAREGSRLKDAADILKANPVAQTVAGATGGAVSQGTGNPYLGAAASLAVPVAGGAIRNGILDTLAQRATRKAAPTTEELASEGSNLFTNALGNPATVSAPAYNTFLSSLGRTVQEEGGAPLLHPKVMGVYRTLAKKVDTEPTLKDLQTARRQINVAAGSNEPDERRIAGIMRDQLDEFVNGLRPRDMASGTMGASAQDLGMARALWSRMKKSELIGDAIEKAKHQASGFENGLRVQFRQLANNGKKMRGFTQDERDAIRAVADGTFTRNSLRRVGKLSFGSGVQSNILNALAGSAIGFQYGNPLLGAAIPATAYVSQRAAELASRRAAEYAQALAALGGKAPPGLLERNIGRANTPGLFAATALDQARGLLGDH